MSLLPTKVNVFWRNTTGGDLENRQTSNAQTYCAYRFTRHLVAYSSKNLVLTFGNSATKLQTYHIMYYSIIFSRVDKDSEIGVRSWIDGNNFENAETAYNHASSMMNQWYEDVEAISYMIFAHIREW